MVELAWQRSERCPAARDGPDLVSLLSDFYSLTMVAINTGSAQAWSILHSTLSEAARVDLQSLTPSQITAVVMDPPAYCHQSVILDASDTFSWAACSSEPEVKDTRRLLKQVLAQRSSSSHPLVLLLECRANDDQAIQMYHSASQIEQNKIVKYAAPHRRDRLLAE